MRPAVVIILPLVYVIFTVTSMLAGLVGLLSLLTGSTKAISRITHAMDVLAAAQLSIFFPSWDGRSTVSNECGRTDCSFCKYLCSILNLAQEDHCKKAAE